ncbi:flagellar hook-length control protein FliK [Stutzerimonas nosocomialis]|uniref:flagellar hook-length control protein FliK n=1 Tax=Stutzerimonas nosocomialis TaxID=1056496 RepID=UPI00110939A5|nr:flagellar hook-length control protein FliK [Stutzerimonas nosocomialis]TLX59181.1 flagellar hook-length control protein FliK [Stutzerimonas nosocomialis]
MMRPVSLPQQAGAAVEGQPQVARPAGFAQRSAELSERAVGRLQGRFAEQMTSAAAAGQVLAAQEERLAQPQPDLPQGRPGQPESAEQPELTAEQWLQGMLEQSLAVVEAREGGRIAGDGAEALSEQQVLSQDVAAQPQPEAAVTDEVLLAMPAVLLDRWSGPAAAAKLVQRPLDLTATPMAGVGRSEQALGAQLDALLATGDTGLADTALPGGERQLLAQPQGNERLLRLEAPHAKWGEQMLQALRDNVEMQLQQRVQNATIRLDPPELGSMEIFLSHESGRLTVQISATNGDVARLLQQTSDRLRHELVGQNFTQVNVQVGADGQSGRGQGQGRQPHLPADEPQIMGNFATAPAADNARGSDSDVLVTV